MAKRPHCCYYKPFSNQRVQYLRRRFNMHCLTWPPPAAESETAANARVGCLTSVCSFPTAYVTSATIFITNIVLYLPIFICYPFNLLLVVPDNYVCKYTKPVISIRFNVML